MSGDTSKSSGEKNLLIMLVEDDLDHAELIIRSLEEHTIANQIRHFTDGKSSLDYLKHRGEYTDLQTNPRPDLILLDLRLPRMDGLEVLRLIKEDEFLKTIPVVVLTTSDADRDVAEAYQHHVNSYLVKPLGFQEFHKLMDDLGFYWLGWNKPPEV